MAAQAVYLGALTRESAEEQDDRIGDAVDSYSKQILRKLRIDREYRSVVRTTVLDMIQRLRESLKPGGRWMQKSGSITLERLDPNRMGNRGDYIYPSDGLAKVVRGGSDLPPIAAGEIDGRYHILDGHHRMRAYQLARARIPALVGRVIAGPEKTVYLTIGRV